MAKIPYAVKRRDLWFARIRIPADLLEFYKPRKEILRSLETKDDKVARVRVTQQKALIDKDFEKVRLQMLPNESTPDALFLLSDADLKGLAMQWELDANKAELERRIKDDGKAWPIGRKEAFLIELKQEEHAARQEMLGASELDAHDGNTTAARYLAKKGLVFSRTSSNFKRLGYYFSQAIHNVAVQRLREWEGKVSTALSSPVVVNPSSPSNQSGYVPERQITLSELYDEYLNDPGVERSASNLNNYKLVCRAIDEVVGNNTKVHEVKRADCIAVRKLLMTIPAHASKRAPGLTLKLAVVKAVQEKLPRLTPGSINGYLQKMSAMFKYAVRESCALKNPAEGLEIIDPVNDKEKRNPFTTEQLQKIFDAPLYTGCVNDRNGYNKPGPNKPRNTRFWLPLLALFQGMRLNEICQLRTDDIFDTSGLIVIRIEECLDDDETNDKKVKTKASVRTVPVHPKLIEFGLPLYVADIRKAGHKRLFPDLKVDKRGYYSRSATRWFSDFLNHVGAKTPLTAFHSFRHAFKDAMAEADLTAQTQTALGGWAGTGAAHENYGSGKKIKGLYNDISKVKYPGLKLNHLTAK